MQNRIIRKVLPQMSKLEKFHMMKRKPMIGAIGKSLAEWANATPETHPNSFHAVKMCIYNGDLYSIAPNRQWDLVAIGADLLAAHGGVKEDATRAFLISVGAVPATFTGQPRNVEAARERLAANRNKNTTTVSGSGRKAPRMVGTGK